MCQFYRRLYRIFAMLATTDQNTHFDNVWISFLHNILIYKDFIYFFMLFCIKFKTMKNFGKIIALTESEEDMRIIFAIISNGYLTKIEQNITRFNQKILVV